MNWYKIAQHSDFYEWYTNKLLEMTNNYSNKVNVLHTYIPKILSEIVKEFGDLTKEQLDKLNLQDLYVIVYLKNGTHISAQNDRTPCERMGGVSAQWVTRAVKQFPEMLSKYVIPQLIEEIKKSPVLYSYYIPTDFRNMLPFPDDFKEELKDYFERALLDKRISYREIPIELRSKLKPSTKEMVVNNVANALKDNDHPENSHYMLDDLKEDILKRINEIKTTS